MIGEELFRELKRTSSFTSMNDIEEDISREPSGIRGAFPYLIHVNFNGVALP
jgi:hypothetical protein